MLRYRFTPDEVEEVFVGNYKIRRSREQLYVTLGETLDGRLAFVVFRRRRRGMIRVVTARIWRTRSGGCFAASRWAMNKRLPSAKMPLPTFHSDKEAAEYFETHSVAEVWDQLPVSRRAKLSKELAKSIQDRHATAKSPISIRLAAEQITAAKRIAAAKSVGYQTQLRMWIAEGIQREAKRNERATRGHS